MGDRVAIGIALALVLAATGARADAGAAPARVRYEEGRQLYAAGRFADALTAFEAARAALPRPEFDFNIALCLETLGRDAAAADAYEQFVRARPDDAEAPVIRGKITRLRAQAARRSSTSAQSPPLTPPTTPSQTEYVAATSGPRAFVSTPRGMAALGLFGSAAALLVAAAGTGGSALANRQAYDTSCDGRGCDAGLYDSASKLAVATDVLIGIGAAAAVGGLILVLTRPRTSARAATASWVAAVRFP